MRSQESVLSRRSSEYSYATVPSSATPSDFSDVAYTLSSSEGGGDLSNGSIGGGWKY